MNKQLKNWFVIQTKKNQENRAIINMQNQKFTIFYPFIKKKFFKKGNWTIIKEFLFPSYFFVQLNLTEKKWLKINNTFGVKKILSFNEKPVSICKKFIDDLKKNTDDDFSLKPTFFEFKPKEKVVINSGPFRRNFGEVVSLVGKDRVKLMLSFMNDNKKIILEKSHVELV